MTSSLRLFTHFPFFSEVDCWRRWCGLMAMECYLTVYHKGSGEVMDEGGVTSECGASKGSGVVTDGDIVTSD